MYLLPLGMAKQVYAGTTSLFFTIVNAVKAVPWLLLVQPSSRVWLLMGICLPAVPTGVWMGWKFNQRLDRLQLYRAGPSTHRDSAEVVVGRDWRLSR